MIARKAKLPIFPVWVDGSWGSIFSFERGKFFKKRPYRIPYGLAIAVGEEITALKPDRSIVQSALMKASAEAIACRFFGKATPEKRNAHQITQLAALPRAAKFNVLEAAGDFRETREVLGYFAKQTGGKMIPEKKFSGVNGDLWIGGGELRNQIESAQKFEGEVRFYDFSELANVPLEKEGIIHLPCLSLHGLVIAMSMPHPPLPRETSVFQAGYKPDSFGKILPGWYLESGHLFPGNIPVPEGLVLDAEGFLVHGGE